MTDETTTSPNQIRTSDKAAKELTMKQLMKRGLSLEQRMDQQKHRRRVLINEHNCRTSAVKEKEDRLEKLLKVIKCHSAEEKSKATAMHLQQIRQLESNLEKMKIKIDGAKNIEISYNLLCEHLKQELFDMKNVLDQKEMDVDLGQAKVEKAKQMLRCTLSAANSSADQMTQTEWKVWGEKREMNDELYDLNTERLELKKLFEMSGQIWLKEEENDEEDELLAATTEVTQSSADEQSDTTEWDMELLEDMEAHRVALDFAEVQQITKEQLLSEKTYYEEDNRKKAEMLADLERRYVELKYTENPGITRFNKLKEEKLTKLNQEVDHVRQLRADLKQTQDLLETIEQGINNLYFQMNCKPVEGSSFLTSVDKLRNISVQLEELQETTSDQEISSQDKEKVYNLLEGVYVKELKNNRKERLTTRSTVVFSDDEEELCPTREEIKSTD
ncbi:GRIP and coiled-coil domain-containing protein 2-like isoform X2 [Kryptolebias marmoratus]|uniref:GRIP and coiled-coil domain-containing protein 2-like isoform X2 n=1 Tax=Kryptolebias marmoratus TaxID=37003 RepID=UPI0018ACDAC6|nr:GRIP and coiled-coil domain-containing protein 2-like isoform X2 [Kryptolebias marmoratus]